MADVSAGDASSVSVTATVTTTSTPKPAVIWLSLGMVAIVAIALILWLTPASSWIGVAFSKLISGKAPTAERVGDNSPAPIQITTNCPGLFNTCTVEPHFHIYPAQAAPAPGTGHDAPKTPEMAANPQVASKASTPSKELEEAAHSALLPGAQPILSGQLVPTTQAPENGRKPAKIQVATNRAQPKISSPKARPVDEPFIFRNFVAIPRINSALGFGPASPMTGSCGRYAFEPCWAPRGAGRETPIKVSPEIESDLLKNGHNLY